MSEELCSLTLLLDLEPEATLKLEVACLAKASETNFKTNKLISRLSRHDTTAPSKIEIQWLISSAGKMSIVSKFAKAHKENGSAFHNT